MTEGRQAQRLLGPEATTQVLTRTTIHRRHAI